jgi:hypothetical protein
LPYIFVNALYGRERISLKRRLVFQDCQTTLTIVLTKIMSWLDKNKILLFDWFELVFGVVGLGPE